MQQDIRSKTRTINRNMFERNKKRERYNKTPLEIMTMNVSMIYNSLFVDYLNTNIDLLRKSKISDDPNLIIEIIEKLCDRDILTEKYLKSLNPVALVGGFLILDNKNIETTKVKFLFEKEVNGSPVINFFKNQNVKEEDIIRYARFWTYILNK